MRLSDVNLRGRTIIGADGLLIGEIAALFLDADTWKIESIQMKLERQVADQIGASRGLFHAAMIEIPIRFVQSVGDTVVLSVSVDELRRISPPGSESASASPH